METDLITIKSVIAAFVFSAIGIAVLFITFFGLDYAVPRFRLWDELIDKQNSALAILLGAIAIGISIIVSAAIHG